MLYHEGRRLDLRLAVFYSIVLSSILTVAYFSGLFSWIYNGDSVAFILHAKFLIQGDGVGQPYTTPAPYYFPDMLMFILFRILGIYDVVVSFILYTNIQVISFFLVSTYILNSFVKTKHALNLCFIVSLILIFCAELGWRNWSLILVPGYHTSALLISLLMFKQSIKHSTSEESNRLTVILWSLLAFVTTLSDQFVVVFFAAPLLGVLLVVQLRLQYGASPVTFTDNLDRRIVFWLLTAVFCALCLIQLIELSDIRSQLSLSSPSDYIGRLQTIWIEVVAVKFRISPFFMTINTATSIAAVTYLIVNFNKNIETKGGYLFILYLFFTTWAPFLFMLFVRAKIENRYTLTFELLSLLLALGLAAEFLTKAELPKYKWINSKSCIITALVSSTISAFVYISVKRSELPEPKVVECTEKFIQENPNRYFVGAGPFFEARVIDAFLYDKVDMFAVNQEAKIGWVKHYDMDALLTTNFFVVDQARLASKAYNSRFIENSFYTNSVFLCGPVVIYFNDSGEPIK